jgi:O-antigen/teichoic acid export membrane protein
VTSTAEIPIATPVIVTSRTKRNIVNLAHIVGGEGLLRVATFFVGVVIARLGGAAVFGMYATALAYVTIAAMVFDNGLQVSAVREVSARPGEVNRTSTRLTISKTILFVLMIAVMVIVGRIVALSNFARVLVALIVLRTVMQSYCQLEIAVMKAIDRVQAVGAIQGTHAGFLLIGMAWCYFSHQSVVTVLWVLVFGQTLELLAEAAWLWRNGIRPAYVNLAECWRLLSGSTTIGIVIGLTTVILRLDVIVLSWVNGAASAGVFAAAQTAITVVYVVAWLTASVLLADMSRLSSDPLALRRFVRHWTKLILVLSIPASILGVAVGPALLPTLFGPGFKATGTLLAIMLPAVPVILLNSLYLYLAIAIRAATVYLGTFLGASVLTLLLALVLDSRLGAVGAALTVLLRETAILITFLVWLRPVTSGKPSTA